MKRENKLLQPRYIVIADYPMGVHAIGAILTPDIHHSAHVLEGGYWKNDLRKYPQIFQPIGWWEVRESSELPAYVKHKNGGKPRRVEKYNLQIGQMVFEGGRKRRINKDWFPSTEQECNNYRLSLTPSNK